MSLFVENLGRGDLSMYYSSSILSYKHRGERLPFFVSDVSPTAFGGMVYVPNKKGWLPKKCDVSELEEYFPKAKYYNTSVGAVYVQYTAPRQAHKGINDRSMRLIRAYTKEHIPNNAEQGSIIYEIFNDMNMHAGDKEGYLKSHRSIARTGRLCIVLDSLRPLRHSLHIVDSTIIPMEDENNVKLSKAQNRLKEELTEAGITCEK